MSIAMATPLEWDRRIMQSCLGTWFGKAKAFIHGGPCFVFANTQYHATKELAMQALEESIKYVEETL